ncbi:ubiquitin-specific protease ubp2 [Sporothrix stenoceras]|uniref:ubiquitinyl hydrolase 1 n=1 Tax=Sporothrix stenoceras TaxID=5173 RepID=A0ABR3ZEM8_9PEZI
MRSASPILYTAPAPCMVPIRTSIPLRTPSPVPKMVFPETAKLVFFARKAHGGKKKRTLIRAVMNPPAYQGTRSRGPVPLPLVEETPHIDLNRPGRLAPRWLQDFVSGDLEDDIDTPGDAFQGVGCASDTFRREKAREQGIHCRDDDTPPVIRHELLLKGHQSFQGEPPSSQPLRRADGSECDEVLACVCQNCRYHFTFYIDRKANKLCGAARGNNNSSSSSSSSSNANADPFHHLVYMRSETDTPRSINTKFYPFLGRGDYTCSAAQCTFKLTVEVSKPRLGDHFLAFLTDNDSISNRLKRAVEDEPERFADVANATPNALAYLRAYLRDIVEGQIKKNADGSEIERKIDQRNKKFFIQFGNGPEAAELLTYLGFEEIIDEDSRAWKVPSPTITRPTRPGSQLAFYQDVKSEVETILGKDSQSMRPNAAISFITNALDIGEFAISDRGYNEYRSKDYAFLGLLPRMHERYFWYAYTCQSQTNPQNRDDYFVCLKNLAQGRNNEDLEIHIQSYDSIRTRQPKASVAAAEEEEEIRLATERSLQDAQPPTVPIQMSNIDKVTQAYNYFGLDEGQRSDDEVLAKFLSNSDAYPSQKPNFREKLLLIARHTQSQNLQRIAVEDMGYKEALSYLGAEKDTDASYIISIAQFSISNDEKDRDVVVAALRRISKERGDDATIASAAHDLLNGQGGASATNVLNQTDADSLTNDKLYLDLALPAGLENIRNTCYLNSILQYFNTVKPVHEILNNFDELGLPNTEESLRARRIDPGSGHLEKGEAYAGRKFVEQLSKLFTKMHESETIYEVPTQRLAIGALKNSARLESDGKRLLAQKQEEQNHALTFDVVNTDRASSPAPPLPVRRAAAPSPTAQNTTVHVNSPASPMATSVLVPDADNNDSSSIMSSQTLVDQNDAQGQSTTDEGWQNVPKVSVSMEELPEDDTTEADVTIVEHAEQAEADVPASPDVTMTGTGDDATKGDAAAPAATTTDIQSRQAAADNVQLVFDPPPVAEPSVETIIELALEDQSVKGTDQQDVEEVMGNIISHLRASVKATGEDADTGVQRDLITDTFFWTSATYSRSDPAGRYNRQVQPNRWVTAFPEEKRKIGLLQALSNSFQREFITQGTWYERFTSIVDLPPILHIHIQRTKGDGTKNKSLVDIPQTLRLDQFMDCLEGSDLFARRRHAWNLQERIRSLKGPNGEEPPITFHPDSVGKAAAYNDLVVQDSIQQQDRAANEVSSSSSSSSSSSPCSADGSSDGDYDMLDDDIRELMHATGVEFEPPAGLSGPEVDARVDATLDEMFGDSEVNQKFLNESRLLTPDSIKQSWARQDLVGSANDTIRRLEPTRDDYERELEALFQDLKAPEYEYLLHAVVCHSGNTGKAGHYWVWIYDFDRCLWRKYNDMFVREHPDTEAVMKKLSNGGEPYYLAYVRASDVKKYVGVSLRKERSATPDNNVLDNIPPPPPRPQNRSLPMIPEVSTAPPVPSSDSRLLATPPLEADDSSELKELNEVNELKDLEQLKQQPPQQEPLIAGLDGQDDDANVLPAPASVPLPTPTPGPDSDSSMQ